ncbi:efflux RND transporter permease subunit [Paracoccus mutanolyticus]|uniref:efflux RND transporter permease subunit n=1 Tax=Paracoccus mutanolyticus TaxID=1499308 RepID=UPI00295005F7|nr:efflux RND transporter permease subunit [Paracoccus mutanolyticus]
MTPRPSRKSIEKVWHTLAEAVVLVFLVILIFLQNWRATLIPTWRSRGAAGHLRHAGGAGFRSTR